MGLNEVSLWLPSRSRLWCVYSLWLLSIATRSGACFKSLDVLRMSLEALPHHVRFHPLVLFNPVATKSHPTSNIPGVDMVVAALYWSNRCAKRGRNLTVVGRSSVSDVRTTLVVDRISSFALILHEQCRACLAVVKSRLQGQPFRFSSVILAQVWFEQSVDGGSRFPRSVGGKAAAC